VGRRASVDPHPMHRYKALQRAVQALAGGAVSCVKVFGRGSSSEPVPHTSSFAATRPLLPGVALLSRRTLAAEYACAVERAERCQYLPIEMHMQTLTRPLRAVKRKRSITVGNTLEEGEGLPGLTRADAISRFLGIPILTLAQLNLNTYRLSKPDSLKYLTEKTEAKTGELTSKESKESKALTNPNTKVCGGNKVGPQIASEKFIMATLAQTLGELGYKVAMFINDTEEGVEKSSVQAHPDVRYADGESLVNALTWIHENRVKALDYTGRASPLDSISTCVIKEAPRRVTRSSAPASDHVIYEFGPVVELDFVTGLLREKRALGNFTTKSPIVQSVLGQKNAVSASPARPPTKTQGTKQRVSPDELYETVLSPVTPATDLDNEEFDVFTPLSKKRDPSSNLRKAVTEPLPELGFNVNEEDLKVSERLAAATTESENSRAPLRILDCTAGFATDAFIIASASRVVGRSLDQESDKDLTNMSSVRQTHIELVEKNPVLFVLLADALTKARTHDAYVYDRSKCSQDTQTNTTFAGKPTSVEEKLRAKVPVFGSDKAFQALTPDEQSVLKQADAVLQNWLSPQASSQNRIRQSMESHYREIASLARRVSIRFGDSAEFLYQLIEKHRDEDSLLRPFDVVYIDTFYPVKHSGKNRSAKDAQRNTKYMQLAKTLHELEYDNHEMEYDEHATTQALIAAARLAAERRVVVKRPLHAPKCFPRLAAQFLDRNTRFDVIPPALGKADWQKTLRQIYELRHPRPTEKEQTEQSA